MVHYLLLWHSNWADEMDVSGLMVLDAGTYDKFKENSKKIRKVRDFSVSIGSNEDIEYTDGGDLLSEIRVSELSMEEYEVLKKHSLLSFGNTDGIEQVLEFDDWFDKESYETYEDEDEEY